MHLYRFSKFPATYTITLWLEYIFSTDFTSDLKWLQIKSESACIGNYTVIRENPHIPRVDDDVTSFQIFLLIFGPFLGHTLLQGRREWKERKVLFILAYQSNISIPLSLVVKNELFSIIRNWPT